MKSLGQTDMERSQIDRRTSPRISPATGSESNGGSYKELSKNSFPFQEGDSLTFAARESGRSPTCCWTTPKGFRRFSYALLGLTLVMTCLLGWGHAANDRQREGAASEDGTRASTAVAARSAATIPRTERPGIETAGLLWARSAVGPAVPADPSRCQPPRDTIGRLAPGLGHEEIAIRLVEQQVRPAAFQQETGDAEDPSSDASPPGQPPHQQGATVWVTSERPNERQPAPAENAVEAGVDGAVHAQFKVIDALRSTLTGPEVLPTPQNGPVQLRLDNVPVPKALEMLSRQGSMNILVSPGVTGHVTADLRNLSFEEALDAILRLCNLVARRENGLLFVYTPEQVPHRERVVRTYPLDFVSAADVVQTVTALLSPVGQAFVTESMSGDNRKTQDVVVVEDIPEHLERIEQYLVQADLPPRQVLIEVRVLEVELSDECRHGVNFEQLMSWPGNNVELRLQELANPLGPGFYIDVDGASLDALVEILETTADAKTLASPKVLVLNGQEARIQIGERFGYRVTRVTETAAVEDVEFLDLGVVLTVTPRISRDNRVVMRVKPEVSDGQLNPETELPEEETTEVETDVLLSDGQGMVIGGLIQEKDRDSQSKIPWLGDVWMVGLLFQRRDKEKVRTEIIVTLTPRVLPYPPEYEVQNEMDTNRAATPLTHGPLCRYPRPWEPILPDAVRNPRVIRLPSVHGPTYPCEQCGRPCPPVR